MIDILADDSKANGGGLTGRAIEREASDEHPQKAIRNAIKVAVGRGQVTVEAGPRRAKLHRIACPCAQCGRPVTSGRERHESCPPPPVGKVVQ